MTGVFLVMYYVPSADHAHTTVFSRPRAATPAMVRIGENGAGTAAAPKLTAIGNKYDSAKLESLLKSPTTAMQLGGMEPVDLKQEDLDALVTYLQSLK